MSSLDHLTTRARRLVGGRFAALSDTARREATQMVDEAKADWPAGKRVRALDRLRRALVRDATRVDVWHLYAQWSLDVGRPDVTFEAVKNVLDLRPWHLDAIELLVELVHARGKNPRLVTTALDNLSTALAEHPEVHRDAVSLVIPARHDSCMAVLVASPDPVARGSVAVYQRRDDAEAVRRILAELDPQDADLAELQAALGRGAIKRADEILAGLDTGALPLVGIRRALRRCNTRQQWGGVRCLAGHYLRAKPMDAWALRLKKRAMAAQKAAVTERSTLSNYQLMKQGFPFRAAAQSPAYAADRQRAFYLLHNSLPYDSAGYATRTHGLLRALDQVWSMTAVTRLGYPFDAPGCHDRTEPIPASDVIDGVDYRRLTTAPGRWLKNPITDYVAHYSEALAAVARQERPFVIHAASNHWNGLTAVETARELGLASVYEVRGLWEVTRGSRNPDWQGSGMYRYIARMEADAAAKATRVIAITGGLKDELIERGVDGDKIVLVPNGVDTTRFTPLERDLQLEQELGLTGKKVIGYVGSVLDYEGLDLLVRAAAVMSRSRDDFHVLIVGDGAERESFVELADELAVLRSHITFTGRVPHADVERYYSLIDIAPFPRLPLPVCELVSPLKPFEAMAMGKAVVASDVRALAEIVTDGENGLLHVKGDLDSLRCVLERLLDDDQLRARLGDTGRRWVERERDWSRLARRVSDIYAEIREVHAASGAGDAGPSGTP